MPSYKRGITLVESLVSILLVSIFLVGILGAFYVSSLGNIRAQHRLTAHNIVKKYLENEMLAGYSFGGYATTCVPETIDGVTYTVSYNPATPTVASEEAVTYKTIGFEVTWSEQLYGTGTSVTLRERGATNVASH
jgi:type II secretory pathway pseudopilin PulG